MKRFFTGLLLVILGMCTNLHAETVLNQVVVVNEGYYDWANGEMVIPVTVGVYSPTSETYSTIDTIWGAQFASDVVVDEEVAYVAAANSVIKYDLNTLERVDEVEILGVRKLAIWENQLLVSRGDLVTFDSYFQVYNIDDFSLVYELSTLEGPAYATEGIVVIEDRAYVAINNAFEWGAAVGFVGEVDLLAQNYVREFDLGVDGINPDNLMTDGQRLFTLNNKDFTGSSISVIDLDNEAVTTANLTGVTSGCGASVWYQDLIYYQELSETDLERFDLNVQAAIDSVEYDKSFYGLGVDPVSNYLYASATDFFSFGTIYILNEAGVEVSSFEASVSPGNFAFDVRETVGVDEIEAAAQISIAPNPATDVVNIHSDALVSQYRILNSIGQEMIASTTSIQVDVSDWPAGLYFIEIELQESQEYVVRKLLVE